MASAADVDARPIAGTTTTSGGLGGRAPGFMEMSTANQTPAKSAETPPETATSDGHHSRLMRWFAPRPLPEPLSPALVKHSEERAQSVQNRAADKITAFSGSMTFVYIHVLWFGLWIGLGVEKYPFGLLTMIVSLEAIFLSTFVMISQNRADAKRQVIANQEWKTVQTEDQQNQELLDLSAQILRLTKELRSYTDTVQAEDKQNQELLDLSRQTLTLTKQVDLRLASDGRPESGSSGTVGTVAPTR
jgi:uncharacterized membrane protein